MWWLRDSKKNTIFIRTGAVAAINFGPLEVRLLFEDCFN